MEHAARRTGARTKPKETTTTGRERAKKNGARETERRGGGNAVHVARAEENDDHNGQEESERANENRELEGGGGEQAARAGVGATTTRTTRLHLAPLGVGAVVAPREARLALPDRRAVRARGEAVEDGHRDELDRDPVDAVVLDAPVAARPRGGVRLGRKRGDRGRRVVRAARVRRPVRAAVRVDRHDAARPAAPARAGHRARARALVEAQHKGACARASERASRGANQIKAGVVSYRRERR